MPGAIHQGFVTLFHNHPELAFQLAARAGAPVLRRYARFEHGPTEFQDPGRAGITVHTDVVLLARGCPDSRTIVDGLSIEVQGWRDLAKRRTVPITRAGVRSRHECAAWALIVCVDPLVRRWLERELFPREPGLVPFFVRPETLPAIVDPARARASIGQATAAAAFHARGPLGVASARATLQAVLDLDLEQRESYVSLVTACLPEHRMKQVAEQLPPEYRDELFPMERESAPFIHGLREGRIEQARDTLITILDARALKPSGDQRARIDDCDDLEQLVQWTARAVVAERVEELFPSK